MLNELMREAKDKMHMDGDRIVADGVLYVNHHKVEISGRTAIVYAPISNGVIYTGYENICTMYCSGDPDARDIYRELHTDTLSQDYGIDYETADIMAGWIAENIG